MDIKFNSLFDSNSETSLKPDNYYNVNNIDQFLLDERIKNTGYILNFDKQKLDIHNAIHSRSVSNLPVTLLSGRPCSTSLCTSNKFCDSSGNPEILHDPPITCENDFMPQGKGHPKRILQNIDVESKLRNIDYTQNKCGEKKKKDPNMQSNKCFTNTFNKDNVSQTIINKKFIKPLSNPHCNTIIDRPLFNMSSKRLYTIKW